MGQGVSDRSMDYLVNLMIEPLLATATKAGNPSILETLLSSSIAPLIATISTLIVLYLNQRIEQGKNKQKLLLEYLNPLRLSLEENYNRVNRIKAILDKEKVAQDLLVIQTPQEVSDKPSIWFNESGCFLISSCYLTACMFYHLKKVREDLPYLNLGGANDTKLWQCMFGVNLAFTQDLGIYYVIQYSIGHDMYSQETQQLLSYREFCQRLQDQEERVWFDRLISFYLDAGHGRYPERLNNVISQIENLSIYIEKTIKASRSIQARSQSEQANRILKR
jgi:hypothetical protein